MKFDLRLKELLRKLKRCQMELNARISSQRFWCASLAGTADHSLAVLCDMTVTCSVETYNGTTVIGNFSDQTLEECLNGASAQRLKQSLAQGSLPLLSCVFCRSLRRCPAVDASMYENEHCLPRVDLLVENTVLCNIDCQDCPRLRSVKLRKKMSLSDEDMEKISSEVSRLGLKQISFLADGEPFLPRNVSDQINVLRQHNPEALIITSTNGTMLNSDEKREGALLLDEIIFSIHGCSNETVARYQKGGSFEKAYANMKAFVRYRNARGKVLPIVDWKYVLFNWNDRKEMILKAVRLAEEAGIDRISFIPTTRPAMGISLRWYFGRFLRYFGDKGSKGLGREVVFPSSCQPPAGSAE